MLDRDYDASNDPLVRIVRAHELGHTMGYNHVTGRTSIMNATPTIEPNAADLLAMKLAFARPPGNKSPDIDPSGFSINSLTAARGVWTDAIK